MSAVRFTACIHFLLAFSYVHADIRKSMNYSLSEDINDAGGGCNKSSNYRNIGSIGIATGIFESIPLSGSIPPGTQAPDLTLKASKLVVSEGSSSQLSAWMGLEDGTIVEVPPGSISWTVLSGPITSIDSDGITTAGLVYQNSTATVRGSYQGSTGILALTILNVNTDNFDSYAGDQIDDAWQVRYFGQPPNADAGPDVDSDGTGQTNLFKFLAGLNPLDGSRMSLAIESVPGQPGWKKLVFGPIIENRNYVVTSSPNLFGGTFTPLGHSSVPVAIGDKLAITDLDASGPAKFYRVEITKP